MTREGQAFWGFDDLLLFLGSLFPLYILASLLSRAVQTMLPESSQSARLLFFQSILYLMVLGSLFLVIRTRYGQPLWRSLGWTLRFRGAWICVTVAPLLAVGISVLGGLMSAPDIQNPIDQLVAGKASLIAAALFAGIIGPLFEELVFRGFLQPLLARALGPWLAILLSALPFALLHGAQYEWSWQHILLIMLAGCAFGLARQVTGSTAAAALLHIGYNVTLVIGSVAQQALSGRIG